MLPPEGWEEAARESESLEGPREESTKEEGLGAPTGAGESTWEERTTDREESWEGSTDDGESHTGPQDRWGGYTGSQDYLVGVLVTAWMDWC